MPFSTVSYASADCILTNSLIPGQLARNAANAFCALATFPSFIAGLMFRRGDRAVRTRAMSSYSGLRGAAFSTIAIA